MKGVISRITFSGMKELLTKNIAEFISMDVEQTVKLCDHWFDQDYIGIIDSLTD